MDTAITALPPLMIMNSGMVEMRQHMDIPTNPRMDMEDMTTLKGTCMDMMIMERRMAERNLMVTILHMVQ